MTNEVFDQGIKILSNSCNGVKFDPKKLKMYRILLSDLDDKVFIAAIVKICRTVENIYPGTNLIAMIHKQCNSLVDPTLMAEEAWLKVCKATRGGNVDVELNFGDEIINSTVRIIGWKSLYYSSFADYSTDKLERLRTSFLRIYKSYQNKAENDKATTSAVKLLGGNFKEQGLLK